MDTYIRDLLKKEVQDYLVTNEKADENSIVLHSSRILGIPTSVIAAQLVGKRKAKSKLGLWYQAKDIIYPYKLNLEQSSSEATAKYKTSLISAGKIGADLTGGFGVDSFFLSQRFEKFFYVEPDKELLEIAKHNHTTLGAKNIEYINSSAEDFLSNTPHKFDLIFIDPSRRNKNQKVFKLTDCTPDVVNLQKQLLEKSKTILIKNAPLLDIQQGLRELQNVSRIIIVAVNNEVKELLFLIDQNVIDSSEIIATDLNNSGEPQFTFPFYQAEEKETSNSFSSPQKYLYEPSVAILKAGAFKTIAKRYTIEKLHPSTHLYTSADLVNNFPGRSFKILHEVKLDKKIQDYFPDAQANIISRNYPLSVEEIKKRTGIKEGGKLYLIAARSENNRHVMICERLV